MSSSTISRWNAIPMERTQVKPSDDFDDDGGNGEEPDTKPQYLRDLEGDQSDDDNVSIISRSPSPKPQDIVSDPMDPRSFREHFGAQHEAVNVNTRISSSNKGFALLAKMGWKEGTGLGLSEDARTDPIPFVLKSDSTGIGKAAMDARIIEATVAQRRDLDSERQMKESDDQRQIRLNAAAQKETVKTEISQVLRPFYCKATVQEATLFANVIQGDICDKQYTNVGQFDEHCNSYAHHHKKRERDLKAAERMKNANAGEADARKEKERLREQKELRKMAKAAGVKLPAVATSPSTPLAPVTPAVVPVVPSGQSKPSGFKKVGWASVSAGAGPSLASNSDATTSTSTPPASAVQTTGGFKRSGWAAMGPTPASASATTGVSEQPLTTSGISSASLPSDSPAGGFKRSGWSNIGPIAPTAANTSSNLETVAAPVSGFKKLGISFTGSSSANIAQVSSNQAPPALAAPLGSSSIIVPAPAAGLITGPDSTSLAPSAAAVRKGHAEKSRSNWSSFKQGAPPAPVAASPQVGGGRGDFSTTAAAPTSGPLSSRRRSRSRSRSRSPPSARRGRSRSKSPPGRRRSRSRSASRSPGRIRRRSRSRSWSRSRSRSRSPAPRHRLPGMGGQRGGGGGGGSGWNNDRGGSRDYRPQDAASRGGGGYSSGRSYSHGYR